MVFTEKEKARIAGLYERLGNAADVARKIHSCVDSVRDCLKQKGYTLVHGGRRVSTNGKRGALSDDEVRRLLKNYKTFDGCATCASRDTGNDDTYKKYWELGGLQTIDHREAHKFPITITNRDLEKAYKLYKGIYVATTKPEPKPKENTNKLEKKNDKRYTGTETRLRIVSVYIRYNGDPKQAAQSMPYSRGKIKKCWAEARKEVIQAHILYRSNSVRAARELGYPETVILRLWQEVGLSPERPRSLRHKHLEDRL